VAARIVYDAFDIIEARTKRPPLEVFIEAIKNVSPIMEVRPRRVGGATYQVPMEVPPHRQFALACRWILQSAKMRSGKSFAEKLAVELIDAANNTGSAIRKREETHRMAEANRAFSHYRI
jgi:small subunit ribosomal protein S7